MIKGDDGKYYDVNGEEVLAPRQDEGHGVTHKAKLAPNVNVIGNQSEGGSFFHNQSMLDSQQVISHSQHQKSVSDNDLQGDDDNDHDAPGEMTSTKKRVTKQQDKNNDKVKGSNSKKKKKKLTDIYPEDSYYESDLLKVKGDMVRGKDKKVRVRLTEE